MNQQANSKKRTARLFAWFGAAILASVGVLVGVEWPWTSPWVIHIKVSILGPGLVYAPLAYDEDR